ncbi:unnamed protein product [Paramecium octaurelia]|uniref:Uncharacterized protein n=1 Tax=Paramecium octaurelia TaxID=43137 RepID=A0A8S1ST45_PAROT|nr:unnamed protein product [Paramecium octaurelia]
MGSKPSKKPDPPKSNEAQLEDQIPVYNRPKSPDYGEQAKIKDVGIKPDDNIDREAANKRQAEKQRNSKIEAQQKISLPQKKIEQPKKQYQKFVIQSSQQNNNSLDLSYDQFVNGLNQNDIKELERQLESDELSPINKTNTESQKQALDEQKIKVAEQKIWKLKQKIKRSFDWPAQGQVYMVSVTFKYNYQYKTQKLAVTQPFDNYVNSILSWKNNEQLGVFEFKLRDVDIYNTNTGDVQQLKFNEIEFMVDYNGVFIGVKHESDFIKKLSQQKRYYEKEQIKEKKDRDQLLNNQLSNLERLANNKLQAKQSTKPKKQKPEAIIQRTEKQLEQFWTNAFQCWYTLNEDEAEKIFYAGQECVVLQKKEVDPQKKLENFLIKKLQDPEFFKSCLNSVKTIKDPLKKWGMFSNEEILEYLGGPKHSVVQIQKKITFPILEKCMIVDGILNNNDLTPLVVKWNQGRKTVIEHERDLFVDIEQEKRLLTFIWDKQLDIKMKLRSENIFVEELNKFRDECELELKETLFQLSTIPNFPMENRPKYKEKYFQIL